MFLESLSSFSNELLKIAAPRWFKVFQQRPGTVVDGLVSTGESLVGQRIRRAVESQAMSGSPKREVLGDLFNFNRSRVSLQDLPMSDPLKRATYFKAGGDYYKLDVSPQATSVKEYGPMLTDVFKDSAATTAKFIEGDKSLAGQITAYKRLGSNRMIDVEHNTSVPDKILSGNIRTPSALHHQRPIQSVFAYPKGSPDSDVFATAEARQGGFRRVLSKVPERSVTYHPSTVRGTDPEIVVPGNVFQKGVTKTAGWTLKEAASVNELARAAGRVRGVIKIPLRRSAMGGPLAQGLMDSPVGYALAPKRIGNRISRNEMKDLPKGEVEKRLMAESVSDKTDPLARHRGKIVIPKGGSSAMLRTPLSGNGKKAINSVFRIHESFERGLKPSQVNMVTGHGSPKVLMDEHNMVSRMTGDGADEAREFIKNLRNTKNEGKALEGMIERHYGQRARILYGEGGKITKAMKKDLLRKFEKTSAVTLRDLADAHFERAEKDWPGFEKNLQRPGFRKAVKTHPYADDKLRRYVENYGSYVSSRQVVASVPSRTQTDKTYEIRKLPNGRLGCGCKDWQFRHSHRGSDCDHIEMARKGMLKKTANAAVSGMLRGMGAMHNFERAKKESAEGRHAQLQILRLRGLAPAGH